MRNIERASVQDAEAILALQKRAFESEARFYDAFDIPPLTQTLGELRAEFAGKVVLKAEVDGALAGSVRGYQDGDTVYVERLVVDPDFQGRGIGTALMEHLESCFGEARRFELFTGYRSERNIHLYERLGYKAFKTEALNEKLSFVFMEKHR